MAKEPATTTHAVVELSPRPFIGTKEPLLEEFSTTHVAASIPTHLPDAINPEGSLRYHKKNWRYWARWLVSRPSVKVFLVLLVIAAISFAPTLLSNPIPINDPSYNPPSDRSANGSASGLELQGEIFQYDWSKPQTISIRWFLWALDDNSNTTFDLYFDDKSKPAFSLVAVPQSWSPNVFDMTHSVEPMLPAYLAPGDSYSFSGLIFAIDKTTNESVPINTVTIYDLGPGDFSTVAGASPPNVNITYIAENGPTTVVYSKMLDITITRSVRAQALTYSMFAINWTLSVASMITTSIIFGHRKKVPDGIIILPITTILTIPAIRNLFVGSPPFGIFLDAVGFFPQMLIVVACIVVLLFGIARGVTRDNAVAPSKERELDA